MKCIVSVVATAALLLLAPAPKTFALSASFTLSSDATTSAGIYDLDGVLVRTLWSNVRYAGGTHTATWNGVDDGGVLRPNGQYELRVLSNNVQYTWEGVLANTSDSFTGPTVYHSLDIVQGMAIWGSNIYLTTGYNEQVTASFKTTTANPQRNTKILSKGAATYHVTTDGTNVYWSATDPFVDENSFVYVTRASDDAEASLSSATSLQVTHGRIYTSAISAVSGTGSTITGLAVQKNGPWLFVSRRALNRVDVLNKTTGVLVQTLTYTSPAAMVADGSNNLWIGTSGTTVGRYSVATDGTLTLDATITTGLNKPLALALSPDDATLVIADGGASQQLKAYSNDSAPSLQWTMGQAGGYANGPSVTNDKFYFRKLGDMSVGSDNLGPGAEWTYVAFQPDGKLWVRRSRELPYAAFQNRSHVSRPAAVHAALL